MGNSCRLRGEIVSAPLIFIKSTVMLSSHYIFFLAFQRKGPISIPDTGNYVAGFHEVSKMTLALLFFKEHMFVVNTVI